MIEVPLFVLHTPGGQLAERMRQKNWKLLSKVECSLTKSYGDPIHGSEWNSAGSEAPEGMSLCKSNILPFDISSCTRQFNLYKINQVIPSIIHMVQTVHIYTRKFPLKPEIANFNRILFIFTKISFTAKIIPCHKKILYLIINYNIRKLLNACIYYIIYCFNSGMKSKIRTNIVTDLDT